MSAGAFVSTPRFKVAIELYNKLDPKQIGKTINTTLQRLTNNKSGQSLFSDQECEQLKQLFNLQNEEFDIIISCCAYIWDQAAFYNLSVDALSKQLLEHNLSATLVEIFGVIWKNQRTQFINKLRSQSFGAPMTLEDINWKLQLTTSSQNLSKTKHLNTLMSLSLVNANDEKDKEQIQMEFTKDELIEFFQKLEVIQKQLDNISK